MLQIVYTVPRCVTDFVYCTRYVRDCEVYDIALRFYAATGTQRFAHFTFKKQTTGIPIKNDDLDIIQTITDGVAHERWGGS